MKMRIFAYTATFLLLWATPVIVGASDQAGAKDSVNQAPLAAATTEKPAVVLAELKFEFDPVVDGTLISHDFMIKNTGEGALAIKQVKTG